MFWKKDVLINNCSESCQGKFSVKNGWKISLKFVFSKVAQSRSRNFYLRKKPAKNTIFTNSFVRQKPQGTRLKVADCQPVTLLKMTFFIDIFQGFWQQISEHLFSRTPLKWLLLQRHIQNHCKLQKPMTKPMTKPILKERVAI